ncbi:MAG: penicillin-binding protein 1A [Gemmobacter sp.]
MIRFVLSFLGALFTLATLGALFGALGLGGLIWFYARDLPGHESLAQYSPPIISRVYSVEGRIVDEFARERRLFTPIEDIPELVQSAFVSAEDKNFWTHSGYDAMGIVAVAVEAVRSRGQNLRGASTITQQVMKNFLLSGDRTAERKIKEIVLATRIERVLTKPLILELYLNEIFLGQNSYGVTAAAQTYFNKTLAELSLEEAATLAALPTQPSNFHPVRNRERLVARRDYVLGQMFENGYITAAERDAAVARPLLSVQAGDYDSFRSALPPRDYYTDEIRRQLSADFGEEEFFTGGLTIRATVEPDIQRAAAKALRDGLERYDRRLGVWRGTGLDLDPGTLGDEAGWRAALGALEVARDIEGWRVGVVLALEGGGARLGIEGEPLLRADGNPHRTEREDKVWTRRAAREGEGNARIRAIEDMLAPGDVVHVAALTDAEGRQTGWVLRQIPEVQGALMVMDVNSGRVLAMQGGFSYQHSVFNRATQARRQPGSAFKPFVYAAALDQGFTPANIVIDAPIEIDTPEGLWTPKNASDKFYGPVPLRTGIEQSRNLMTIRLAQETGMETVARYAEAFGVYDRMDPFLANSLGAGETTLWRMVAAYAMFANGGQRVEPTLVDRVQDRRGRTVYRHDRRLCLDCEAEVLPDGAGPRLMTSRQRVMDAVTAYQLTSMMEGVIQRGTARMIKLPVPVAGKTGTTNDNKDAWFVGYTSTLVAGCYIGFDTPRPMPDTSGGGLCGPVFQDVMAVAIERFGGAAFDVPPGGYFARIDRFTGARLPDDAEGDNVIAEYFRDGVETRFGTEAWVDGGFAMGSNLPLFGAGEAEAAAGSELPPATCGTVSSGGLY